jgi:hypothetical protein
MIKQRHNFLSRKGQIRPEELQYITLKRPQVILWATAFTGLYLEQLFTYCFDKKGLSSQDMQEWLNTKPHKGHINKIFRYETFRLLRSYSTSIGKDKNEWVFVIRETGIQS